MHSSMFLQKKKKNHEVCTTRFLFVNTIIDNTLTGIYVKYLSVP